MRTAYINGKVYTGEGFSEAFVTENGRFVKVGTTAEIAAEAAEEMVDLKGTFVCPGFIDSHMHVLSFGNALNCAPLHLHTESLEDLLAAMKAHYEKSGFDKGAQEEKSKSQRWLIGRGWNQDYFTDVHRMPNRYDLDQVSKDVPIAVVRCCGHCVAVNSKALEICGVTAETQAPEGGSIGRMDGEPDGIFFDNAMPLVMEKIPVPDKAMVKSFIKSACEALNSYGVTSCHSDDYSVFRSIPFETVNEAFKELEAEGALSVRVYEQSNFESLAELKRFVEAGNVSGVGTESFKIGPLKMLGDGSLGARTAFLREPYADNDQEYGLPVFTQEEFDEMIGYAHEHGMHCAVHAIGDACLDHVLNAYEKALAKKPVEDHRHGIVHCQISGADELERIAKLNLHVYAQTIFLDYDIHIVEERVGKERAATSYNWKTLMKKGVHVSNGTDCPVELPDALRGMQCAVTRKTIAGDGPYLPDQAFTVKEALDSYTKESARASFEENVKGQIKEGFLADFVVLGADPFEVSVEEIHSIPVEATFVGGECKYRR